MVYFCLFLPHFMHLLVVLRQKKAHICLPRQCVLFSTKSADAEEIPLVWDEIASR